jgi:hypothetical protein
MSAIKEYIESVKKGLNELKNARSRGVIFVASNEEQVAECIIEISDRLDALEKKAHEPLPPMRVYDIPVDADGTFHPDKATLEAVHYFDTERSCMKCRSYNGCQATAEELGSALPEKGCADYEPKPDTEPSCDEPAQEHGGDDGVDYRAEWYKSLERESDLRARLADAERIARENGELAIARKVDVERLEKEQGDILFLVQTRLQPPGSPCPGGPVMLVTWITGEAVKKIERLEKENAELKRKLSEVKP